MAIRRPWPGYDHDPGNGTYTTYAFDAAGRAARVANVLPGGSIISSFGYSFDAVGNPTSLLEAMGIESRGPMTPAANSPESSAAGRTPTTSAIRTTRWAIG